MIDLKKSTKYEFYIVIFLIIIIQLVLNVQGFDVCDDGFVLTFYQQFFNSPESVEYNFVYWFSGLVGGLWYQLYPEGGIFWFRIFTVIINTLLFVVTYQVFKQFIYKRIAILGLLIVLFVNDFGFLTFYHNPLTALLAALSVLFLLRGITKNSKLSFLIAGLIIGINVFTRIPNITLLVFLLAIPFHNYLKEKNFKKSIQPVLISVLGVLLGFFITYIILLGLGQIEIMKRAMLSLFHLGKEDTSAHNVFSLFQIYRYNYKNLAIVFCELIVIILLFFGTNIYFNKKKLIRYGLLTIGFVLVFLWFKNGNIYTVYAIGYLGTLLVIFSKNENITIKTIAFIGFLMQLFLPLGSGNGILSCGYISLWFAVPMFFYYLLNLEDITIEIKTNLISKTLFVSKQTFTIFIALVSISYFSSKALNVSREAYFDKGSRFLKTYQINNELANGIYTTKQRADIINDLLLNLNKYVKPNDYLLAYDKIPMIHFLTKTKPYMYNPWVWIYDGNTFTKKLRRAEVEINVYPIVVQQKFETINSFSKPIAEYMYENYANEKNLIHTYVSQRNEAMNLFLFNNEYEIVWSNSYFNIYKTNKMHK